MKTIVLGLAGASLVLLLAALGPVKVVVSGSMAPEIQPGDALWLRPADEPIFPGTIITFRRQGRLVTHRVVAVEGGAYITRGDQNPAPDLEPVLPQDVVGIPFLRIPYLGYGIAFLQRPLSRLIFLSILALSIAIGRLQRLRGVSRHPVEAN